MRLPWMKPDLYRKCPAFHLGPHPGCTSPGTSEIWREEELRLQVQPFSSALETFVLWAQGEYSSHPNSWKRLRISMTSLKLMFGRRPLSSITRGDIENYKYWRRREHKVREVTSRHHLQGAFAGISVRAKAQLVPEKPGLACGDSKRSRGDTNQPVKPGTRGPVLRGMHLLGIRGKSEKTEPGKHEDTGILWIFTS